MVEASATEDLLTTSHTGPRRRCRLRRATHPGAGGGESISTRRSAVASYPRDGWCPTQDGRDNVVRRGMAIYAMPCAMASFAEHRLMRAQGSRRADATSRDRRAAAVTDLGAATRSPTRGAGLRDLRRRRHVSDVSRRQAGGGRVTLAACSSTRAPALRRARGRPLVPRAVRASDRRHGGGSPPASRPRLRASEGKPHDACTTEGRAVRGDSSGHRPRPYFNRERKEVAMIQETTFAHSRRLRATHVRATQRAGSATRRGGLRSNRARYTGVGRALMTIQKTTRPTP